MCVQVAERDLQSTQAELAETQQRGDSELTRLGEEYDLTKQALETLEVCFDNICLQTGSCNNDGDNHIIQVVLPAPALIAAMSLPVTHDTKYSKQQGRSVC